MFDFGEWSVMPTDCQFSTSFDHLTTLAVADTFRRDQSSGTKYPRSWVLEGNPIDSRPDYWVTLK